MKIEATSDSFFTNLFDAIIKGIQNKDYERMCLKQEAEKALTVGSKKFIVSYFYLASGMDGRADTYDREVWAECENEAIQKHIVFEYPEDEMYGNNHSMSSRAFLRGCLSAKEVQ